MGGGRTHGFFVKTFSSESVPALVAVWVLMKIFPLNFKIFKNFLSRRCSCVRVCVCVCVGGGKQTHVWFPIKTIRGYVMYRSGSPLSFTPSLGRPERRKSLFALGAAARGGKNATKCMKKPARRSPQRKLTQKAIINIPCSPRMCGRTSRKLTTLKRAAREFFEKRP